MTPEQIVLSLFTAVESGDLGAIGAHFAENATYCNVPYEPAEGRSAIVEMFRPIVTRSERIEWQIRSIATAENREDGAKCGAKFADTPCVIYRQVTGVRSE